MKENGNDFEQIRREITSALDAVRVDDARSAQIEQETRNKHAAARARMAAALDAGNMADYKAAGIDAEGFRLELEFIEESRKRGKKPGATAADDARITDALRTEAERVRLDALAQLRQIFTKAADVAADALRQFAALDGLSASWSAGVMRRNGSAPVCSADARLNLAQLEQVARGALNKYQFIKGA